MIVNGERFIKMNELKEMLSVGKSTIWDWIANHDIGFPKPYKVGKRAAWWKLSEIEEWVASRKT